MYTLDEEVRDALTETLNIGVGRAAAGLSELLGDEVRLGVPRLDALSREQMLGYLRERHPRSGSGMIQAFSGPVGGKAVLLFSDQDALRLVRLLLHYDTSLEDIAATQQEALVEVGNIILNSCLASLSEILGTNIETSVPRYFNARIEDALDFSKRGAPVWLLLQMDMSVEAHAITGMLSFVLSGTAIETLGWRLANGLRALAG
jgi:chemotaxis protein CheC